MVGERMTLTGVHDTYLVVLSIIIAIGASFTALSLANRVRTSNGRRRFLWLFAAATSLGGGIWSMHFVAMLAFRMPGMHTTYDLAMTLESLGLAIGFTGVGLATVNWRSRSLRRTIVAGLLIGTGVASMHYLGMAAMRMQAAVSYDPLWVIISIMIAMAAATAAVWLAVREHQRGQRTAAAIMMGSAIAGMHYSGMYAAVFTRVGPENRPFEPADFGPTYLAAAISVVTLLILLLALVAVQLERLFQNGARREARLHLLADVNDHLFESADASYAMRSATEILGMKLGVSRCAYADVDEGGHRFWIRSDYCAAGQASSVGEYSLDLFGSRAATQLRDGTTLVVRDVVTELARGEGREMFQSIGIGAIVCCPLIKDGRLSAMMAVHQDRARDWSDDELTLVKEVVERCWAHVQRIGAENRLRDSEERLRLAVDNADVGFWDVDIVHDKLIWPARTKAMFGISADVPVTMQDFYDGLYPDDRERTAAAYAAAADPQLRALYDVEYRTVGKEDGVVRWVAAKGRGVFDAAGTCLRVAGTAVDISLRKEAEEALRELNATLEVRVATAIQEREDVQEALRHSQKMEAMGQLTGGVAHDFNNLLTPIIGSLDLLQRKGLGSEREQRLIGGAMQSAERARVLVQRLLAFARRQPLQLIAVDIGKLILGMGELVSSTLGPQIEVVMDVPDNLPSARADPNQLEMAILNLAVNARDAMPEGGKLRIAASAVSIGAGHRSGLPGGAYLYLTVADTGVGMDAATVARAVEPFYSTKGVGKGTGLGLSMVHGLALQLDGAMHLDSAEGVGTIVELWLPESDEIPATEVGSEKSDAPVRTGTALVVDDEELVRMSTAEMLIDLGFAVVEAASGEDAIRLIGQGIHFDLMVTDHLMPGMSGTALADRVRISRPGVPVLIVSGYAESQGIDPALPRLAKPFRKDELAASLRAVSA